MPISGPPSGTSSFLTPFLPGPHDTSPPPKPEAEDYFNVHGYSSDDKRPNKNKDRDHYSEHGENEEPISGRHSSISQSLPVVSACSECEACMVITTQMDASNILTETVNSSDKDSPAINALRKLSQHQPPDARSELQGLRRMSTALSSTLNFLRAKTPSIDSSSSDLRANPMEASRSQKKDPSRKRLGYGEDSNHPIGKLRKDQTGLTTPTSITLRKASNVRVPDLPRSSMSASLSHEDERMRAPDAPTSELLAFYSSHTERVDEPESLHFISSHDRSSSSAQASMNLANTTSYNEPPAPIEDLSNLSRRSMLAPATMTFTDVHVAPGTFAVGLQSRKQSSAASDQNPRRISVVHFKSRKSIHEVVWREDETTSSSSPNSDSRASSSPPFREQSVGYNQPALGSQGGSAERGQHAYIQNAPVLTSLLEQPQGNLFQWSWAKPTVSSIEEVPHEASKNTRPNLTRMASASNPDLSRPRMFSYALNINRRSVSEAQDILSFPPLRDRSSTLDWCRAPLVDPNDPLGVRGQQNHARDTTPSNESGSCASTDKSLIGREAKALGEVSMQREKLCGRRASSHPYAPARLGRNGSMGSSLGASSHVRVSHPHRF